VTKRGEIVVFEYKAAEKRLIKRLVGLPGDVISMTDGRLYIISNHWLRKYSVITTVIVQIQEFMILFHAMN
jgi:signal peptidase I